MKKGLYTVALSLMMSGLTLVGCTEMKETQAPVNETVENSPTGGNTNSTEQPTTEVKDGGEGQAVEETNETTGDKEKPDTNSGNDKDNNNDNNLGKNEDKSNVAVNQGEIEKAKSSTSAVIKLVEGLSDEDKSWSWKRNNDHTPPQAYADMDMLSQYDAYYLGDTNEKVIYLTFDNGYENGYTPTILDALKERNVKATFFITKAYIRDNKDLVIRMKEEGHIIGNHTMNHPRLSKISVEDAYKEIKDLEAYMEEATGYKLDMFFRPPQGGYSEKVLAITKDLGYKTIFWSMAYEDWVVDKQPGKDFALDHVLTNAHPGMIPLLHSVSSSNAEALGDIIDQLHEQGYRFGELTELE